MRPVSQTDITTHIAPLPNPPRSGFYCDPHVRAAAQIESRLKYLEKQSYIFAERDQALYQSARDEMLDLLAVITDDPKRKFSRLVIHSIITQHDPEEARQCWISGGGKLTNEEHAYWCFGDHAEFPPAEADPEESHTLRFIAEKRDHARAADLQTRLNNAAAEWHRRGWYVLFWTLTWAPEYSPDVLSGKSFKKFLARARRAAAKASGLPESDALEYCAVLETGEKNGREHIHLLMGFADIPDDWKSDPNAGRRIPNRREIRAAKDLWDYGINQPKAVRYSPTGDAFSRLGWKWPVEQVRGKWLGVFAGTTQAVQAYVVKYALKSFQQRDHEVKPWRVRMTRNLGTMPVKLAVKALSLRQLLETATNDRLRNLKFLGRKISPNMIRYAAIREFLTRIAKRPSALRRFRIAMIATPSRPTLVERLRMLDKRLETITLSHKPNATKSMTTTWKSTATSAELGSGGSFVKNEKKAARDLDTRKIVYHALQYVQEIYYQHDRAAAGSACWRPAAGTLGLGRVEARGGFAVGKN